MRLVCTISNVDADGRIEITIYNTDNKHEKVFQVKVDKVNFDLIDSDLKNISPEEKAILTNTIMGVMD